MRPGHEGEGGGPEGSCPVADVPFMIQPKRWALNVQKGVLGTTRSRFS
jgi:hypothetical protein